MKQIKKKFADKRFFINGAYRNATSLTQEEILEMEQTGFANYFEPIKTTKKKQEDSK
jgi:hypothetical protein